MRPLFIAVVPLLLTTAATAADTASFTVEGRIIEASCTIEVVGTTGANIVLESQRTTALTASGVTAGRKAFQIKVHGCVTGAKIIYFDNTHANITTTGGRLKNTATGTGAATGVDLQLLRHDNTAINLSLPKATQNATPSATPGATAATAAIYNFAIEYYATAQVTVGSVTSSLTFVVEPV